MMSKYKPGQRLVVMTRKGARGSDSVLRVTSDPDNDRTYCFGVQTPHREVDRDEILVIEKMSFTRASYPVWKIIDEENSEVTI
jgi:hypothetical protein